MDINTWNWAFAQMINALSTVFGYAVQAAGVATVTILALIWLAALIRLIVAPLLGRSIGSMLDTALNDTARQLNRKEINDKRIAAARRQRKWDKAVIRRQERNNNK